MRLNKQSGQALVITAVAMVVLALFAGLGIDMGVLRFQKRLQQSAADSAAIAGAQNLDFGSAWVAGGQNASAQNGFTDNNGGAGCSGGAIGCVSVAINNGPSTGPHAGDAKYVEAIVTTIQPTYFIKIFGTPSAPVTARAVATNISGGSTATCLQTLGPPTNAITGIDAQGSAILNAARCGIADNGNLDTTGNKYKVYGNTISVSGQCLGSHCGPPDVVCESSPTGTCPPLHDAPASADPMAGLAAPPQPAASTSCPAGTCDVVIGANTTATINPGTYNSLTLQGKSSVTMNPGIYYFNGPLGVGGITMKGGASLTDLANPGVMIYFTNGSTMQKFVGGGNTPDVNLSPMTTAENATYAGILIFQDPADTAPAYLGGDDNSTFNGTIYMPTSTVTFFGDNHVSFNGSVTAYSVDVQGNPTVNFGTAPSGVPIPAQLTQPVLVE
jgi:hypothetical protein